MKKNDHQLPHKSIRYVQALLLCLLLATGSLFAQNVTINVQRASVKTILKELQAQTDYKFVYNDALVEMETLVSLRVENEPLESVLKKLFDNKGISYEIKDQQIVLFPSQQTSRVQPLKLVQGTVMDNTGHPLPGAAIAVKGNATKYATADVDGNFELTDIPKDAIVVVSFLGYETLEYPVNGRAILNIVLILSNVQLDEVVVTGYQSISREKMTGATATVTSSALSERYTPNLLDNLEGRIAGLGTYGGKPMIRGVNSLRANISPLLVIDGLPVDGDIEDINPFDIKSITVLKDAAATAIYGARAANGIIVVETKQAPYWELGARNVTIDASANITVYQKKNTDYADNFYMTPAQQIEKEMGYAQYYFFDNGGAIADPVGNISKTITDGGALAPVMYNYYLHAKGEISESELQNRMDDLQKNNFAKEYAKHVLRPRTLQQYNVAVRSAGEKFQSNLVLNFRGDNTGYVNQSDKRFNVFYKGIYNVTDWMSVNFGINAIVDDIKEANSERIGSENPADPFNVPAYFRLLNSDGSYTDYTTSDYNIYNTMPEDELNLHSVKFNHLKEMYRDLTKTSRQHMRYHADLRFRIVDGLSAETKFTYENVRSDQSSYSEADSYTMRFMNNIYTSRTGTEGNYTYKYLLPENGGKLKTVNIRSTHWTARGQVNYNQYFGKHSVDVIAGLEFRQIRSWGTRNLLFGYDDQLQIQSTTSVSYADLYAYRRPNYFKPTYYVRDYIYNYLIDPQIGLIRDEIHRYGSGYVNATYMYDHRYNAFASFRRDYTDVFGLEAKYRGKPLWSVGAGWNVHNETFMKEVQWIDFLKARITYGVTGNIYHGATSFMTASTRRNNSITKLPMSVIQSPANPDLTWEETATLNTGVDFSLFENRLTSSIDWYRKKTTDLFSEVTIESTKGFPYLIMNSANVVNKGVDLSLSYDWFTGKNGGFYWNTSMTVGYNNNKINKIEERAKTWSALAKGEAYKVGYAVNSLFSTQFAGVDQGWPTWYTTQIDEKGNPVIVTLRSLSSSDLKALVYSGQKDPKTTVGFTNYFSYKGISLNILMVYYGGHHLRAQQALAITQGLPYRPLQSYWLNSWTPENENTNVPGFGQHAVTSIAAENTYSDIYVRRGDFIKIRNIVIGYEVPQWFISKIGLKNLSLSFQINNPKPLWLKNDIGIDPETIALDNPYVFTRGVRLPTSYVFGMNINF